MLPTHVEHAISVSYQPNKLQVLQSNVTSTYTEGAVQKTLLTGDISQGCKI